MLRNRNTYIAFVAALVIALIGIDFVGGEPVKLNSSNVYFYPGDEPNPLSAQWHKPSH